MTPSRLLSGLFALAWLVSPANAAVIVDWTDASVNINIIDTQNAVVSGLTTGDAAVPFSLTISTVVSTQQVTLDPGPFGGLNNVLNLNLPATRQAGTLMTVTLSLGGSLFMQNPSFTMLDIDAAPTGGPPFANWQDLVTFQSPGFTLTAVNPAFVTTGANTALGIDGNVPNSSPDGNVNISYSGNLTSFTYVYGPANPNDQFGSNQRHGLTNISMTGVIPVPEPSSIALLGLVAVGGSGLALVRRKRLAFLKA